MKIMKNVVFKNNSSCIDIKQEMEILFHEHDPEKDALFVPLDRLLRDKLPDRYDDFVSQEILRRAINSMRSNMMRYCREISQQHRAEFRLHKDSNNEVDGVTFKFKRINK